MKIAFVQAPAWGRDCPPYTMCFLASLVRQQGHQAYLFDLNNTLYHTSPNNIKKMWDDKDYYSYWENRELVCEFLEENNKVIEFYVNKILNTEARIIGFTVHFSSCWASLEIAKKLKEKDKSRLIVFGGPDCSRQQKGNYFIQQDCIDLVVHGEGEYPLFEIIDNIESIKEKDSLKGCLKLKAGRVCDGGYAPGPQDLDSLPFVGYSDFKEEINLRMYREPNRLDIFDSRGCITGCHFCSEWQFWGKFRSKSGKRIYEEIERHLQDFPQVNQFYFIGSLVNGNMNALEEFCDLSISHQLGIQWQGQAIIRPEMTKGLLEKMQRAGCSWISYGIESGSQRVLERMNKRFSLELAHQVLGDTKEAGIATQANFMFGLPTETREDFLKTLEFLRKNRKYMDTILASQSFCVIDKGTYLHRHPEQFGIKNRGHHLYWDSNSGENNYPERLSRYEEFCQLALSLGMPETSGVLECKPDRWQALGDYFYYKKDYNSAIRHYLEAEEKEAKSRILLDKISRCYAETNEFNKSKEALNRALKIKYSTENNGLTDQSIMQSILDLDNLSNCLKSFRVQKQEGLELLDSIKLAKVLGHYAQANYKGVFLEKIFSSFKFNEKQKSMSQALYSHGLWRKLSNYILADVQKAKKETFLYSYPYWLVVDPCNYCQLSCPFCPTGQKRNVRKKAKLSFADFKAIMDKLGPYLIHIDLVNWGEPLLNEDIFRMIKYAKGFHCDIKLDSNLNSLNEDSAEEMVLSGLDKIVVSIDGLTEETYSKYRVGGNFKLAMDNLKLLIKKRQKLKSRKPYITWQFLVFRHNEHEIEQAQRMGRDLGVDHVGITKAFIGDKNWIPLNTQYSNYNLEEIKGELTYDSFKVKQDAFCHWPWEAITINPNGTISACCSVEEEKDDFGNIFDESIEYLWNNQKYISARDYIKDKKNGEALDNNICFSCRHLGLINIDILSCHSFFDTL